MTALPDPFDPGRAARTFEALAELGFVPDDTDRPVLAAVFGNSPFLARLALREHATLPSLLADGSDPAIADAILLALSAADAATEAEAMARLRVAKRRAALAIALADIAGHWPLERVTRALTEFADACVKGALRFMLRAAADRAEQAERDGAILEETTALPCSPWENTAPMSSTTRPTSISSCSTIPSVSHSASATTRAARPSIWCAAWSSC